EQLCRERIAAAELGQKKVVYILPYQNAGVWHCVLRTSDFFLVISVSGNRKMKAVHKDLRSNMVTGKRDDIVQRENFFPIVRVWGEILCCKHYYGAIELLDPCWWTHYASCVLQANSPKRKRLS
ncbi:hypothetical protein KCU78_g24662, partial [Aureobasidium melanogenum]